jgi:DNA-binding transcriptional LysR family regulator
MDISRFDLNLLKVLDTLLIERSTTQAAHRLNLSQSAVSSALARLRDATGDALFERKYGGLEPTPIALAMEPEIRELMARLERTLATSARFEPTQTSRTFRVAASDYFGDFLMGPLAKRFHESAPNAALQLMPLDSRDHLSTLERFSTDLIIFLSLPIPEWMRSKHVYESRFRIISRTGHPALKAITPGATIPLDTYCAMNHGLYSPSGEKRTWMDTELSKQSRQRHISLSTSTFHSLARVIEQTDLIATVPKLTASEFAKRYALEVYQHPLSHVKSELMMAWHYRRDKKLDQIWFRQLMEEELGKLQATDN